MSAQKYSTIILTPPQKQCIAKRQLGENHTEIKAWQLKFA